jgi:hypothetical protein
MKTVYLIGCVKRDIMRWVQRYSSENPVDLTGWYCGITHNDDSSKLEKYLSQKGNTNICFRRWLANDLTASNEILSFFVKKGMKSKVMKGKPNGQIKYVYVFKVNPKILDEVLEKIG